MLQLSTEDAANDLKAFDKASLQCPGEVAPRGSQSFFKEQFACNMKSIKQPGARRAVRAK